MRMIFGMSWNFALILGAIATATAPASTMMTIHQYHARGDFVNVLLQVVALDDVVCLLTFSAVVAVVNARTSGHISFTDVSHLLEPDGSGTGISVRNCAV
jgi:Kef-type K+ transport system membrane component KefB